MKRTISLMVLMLVLVLTGCKGWLKTNAADAGDGRISVERYDRIESLYLTTGDYSALQQMNTSYPMQTRTLIEDVLRLGKVDDADINGKFLTYFQDSTLQHMLAEVQRQYADVDDVSNELTEAFRRLRNEIPSLVLPQVYAQIGAFDQSIVVVNNTLGISLDKYLGADYPFYETHYSERERSMMGRDMIVPDCLSFYILSLYPLSRDLQSAEGNNAHMGKIQWVVNRVTGRNVFANAAVEAVDSFMKAHKQHTVEQLLSSNE